MYIWTATQNKKDLLQRTYMHPYIHASIAAMNIRRLNRFSCGINVTVRVPFNVSGNYNLED